MNELEHVDVLVVLARRWKALALFAFVGAVAGVAYCFVAPAWYEARLAVVQSQRSQDSATMSLAAKLPVGLDTYSTDVQRIQAVLTSTSVSDEIIDKFKLQDRYGESSREGARSALWEHCSTGVDRKAGVVSLTCEDQDPQMATDIATNFGEVGNRVFGRVSSSSAHEERHFLETQVGKAREEVDEASRKLKAFQEEHKIVDLPEQSKATISAMASIEGELLSKQLELSYLSSFSSRTEASVQQLQQQIGVMQAKLQQLETSARSPEASAGSAKNGAFFPGAMEVPALRFELEQLVRQQKVMETKFFLMNQRFEMAKIDEARDTSTFQILDRPTTPTVRSRPKRKKTVLLAFGIGFAAGAAFIVLPMWWRRRTSIAPVT